MTAPRINQPSKAPNRKVTAGLTIATPLSIVLVWVLTHYGKVDMPPEIAVAAQGVVQGLVTLIVQYFVRDEAP